MTAPVAGQAVGIACENQVVMKPERRPATKERALYEFADRVVSVHAGRARHVVVPPAGRPSLIVCDVQSSDLSLLLSLSPSSRRFVASDWGLE